MKWYNKSYSKPLIFFGALVITLIVGPFLSLYFKSLFYACSLLIKDLLIFSLPFVIFCLIFGSISALGAKAIKYVAIIIPLICLSNFINTMLSYIVSGTAIKSGILGESMVATNTSSDLTPLFTLNIHNILSNNVALIGGLLSGLLIGVFKKDLAVSICKYFDKFTKVFFKILFPLMPIFISGTALKLQHDEILVEICQKYLPILLVFVLSTISWILFQFFTLAKFNVSQFNHYIRNLIPACITAFGSMSSAAALPLSIAAAEKNLSNNKCNASIIAPSSVNIHLVGDCLFIPMVALSVLTSFGAQFPSIGTYLSFAFGFVLAKFSVAAVPGGGVLVMLPIMQDYLHMSPEMLGIVTALYILFDPIITTCNVLGNGSLAIIFDNITRRFNK
ncbi:MAG: cation:dicarboxylase symporter family transporter [Alphaproteobacteria bacterium]|nr:cation:dicarboxylase symporter family transporter [Alphaproteobacteria bacterium]